MFDVLPEGFVIYERSVRKSGGAAYALVKDPGGEKFIYVYGEEPSANFSCEEAFGGWRCPLVPENAFALAHLFPWLWPRRLQEKPSFGFGDRIGLATPGHIRALCGANVFPIFAQQSVRENARTGRSFSQVLASAIFGAFQEGYEGGFGADADHLKRIEDAVEAARLGYTFFTCDPSDRVQPVERLSEDELGRRFRELPQAKKLTEDYLGRNFLIRGLGRIRFSERELAASAVKYSSAIEFAVEMYRAISDVLQDGFDFELSLDEAETPTTPIEHYFVVEELKKWGVELASLAPRFGGTMEKAVDYRGSLEVFRRDLCAHVAIAKALGPYRISLHSGSDKFSLYPVLAREGEGMWHVKTAGTSFLVALEVVARVAPYLFREIAKLSFERFPENRASYHLSTDLTHIPPIEKLSDAELPELLRQDSSRQVLHVAFGSVLTGPLGVEMRKVLQTHEETYYQALSHHLDHHLTQLGVK